MGGTFDPIHFGHLFVAEEVRTRLNLDKIIFMPTGLPPHKNNSNITQSIHRYAMALIATGSNPYFEVSTIELDKKEISYTIDTVKELKKLKTEVKEFYFITGADALLQLSTWKNIGQLINECKFIAATRPGFEYKDMEEEIERLEKEYNTKIYEMSTTSLQISSTEIRDRVKKDCSIRYLLPEAVRNYIYKYGLYK